MNYKKIYTKKLIIKKYRICNFASEVGNISLAKKLMLFWMDGWSDGWMNQWMDGRWMDVMIDD